MKSKNLRAFTAAAVIAAVFVGLVAKLGIGTLSAPGLGPISVLCPLGALGTMLASHTAIPRAVVSLVVVLVILLVFGRAFCAWICPVPAVTKIRGLFSGKKVEKTDKAQATAKTTEAGGCGSHAGCAACKAKRGETVDTRHFVLGGAIFSTLIFGFPVFCLVCPIGLTFATVVLLVNLFTAGDVTWSVVVVPALLAAEVIFFRKWCTKICPLSALMSLVSKGNKTFVPAIDNAKCLETSGGKACGACGCACPEGIDIRHPDLSVAAISECTKCRECVDACPTSAVSMPLLPKKQVPAASEPVVVKE